MKFFSISLLHYYYVHKFSLCWYTNTDTYKYKGDEKMDSISKSDIDKTFGILLRDYRIKAGLTQEKLAEQLGISLKYISRI